jgi:hypothetical protein
MQIHRKHFPEVIPDNDMVYLAHLQGIIDSIDELSSMEITRTPNSYHFRIATSLPKYNNLLLEELLKLHNLFQIKMNMSKSIKSSATIVYEIEIN